MKQDNPKYVRAVGMGIRGHLGVYNICHPVPEKIPSFNDFVIHGPEETWDVQYFGYIHREGNLCDYLSFGKYNDYWIISEKAAEMFIKEVGEKQVSLHPLPLRSKVDENVLIHNCREDGWEEGEIERCLAENRMMEDIEIGGYYFPVWKRMPDCVIPNLSRVRWCERTLEQEKLFGVWHSLEQTGPGGPITIHKETVGDSKIFRLRRMESLVIVRDDLVRAIKKAGLTGFNYMKAREFPIIPVNREILIDGWQRDGRNQWEIEHLIAESGILDFEPE